MEPTARSRWALPLLFVACAPALDLELSAVPGARTVVALEDDGMFVSWTYVLDVEDDAAFEMPYPTDQITLVYAPRSPDELGLTKGLQPLSDGTGKTLLDLGFTEQRVWRSGTGAGHCIERFELDGDTLRLIDGLCTRGGDDATFVDTRDGMSLLVQTTYGLSMLTARDVREFLSPAAIGNVAIAPDGSVVTVWNGKVTTNHAAGGGSSQPVEIVGESIAAIDWVEGRGMMLGGSGGFVMTLRGGRWEPIGSSGLSEAVVNFAPWPGGFVVSGGTEVARYGDAGFCPVIALGRTGPMVPLAGGLLLGGQRDPFSAMLELTWVDFEPN